jgi:hypothetical protein
MQLTIDLDKVCYVVVKARQFDAKEGSVDGQSESASGDENTREVLTDLVGDAAYDELLEFIRGLDEDGQCALVALMWVGRGDFDKDSWDEALKVAHDEHNQRTAEYLLGTPLLADYLEEGLAEFGRSCIDIAQGRL